jgi:hypothetical protein
MIRIWWVNHFFSVDFAFAWIQQCYCGVWAPPQQYIINVYQSGSIVDPVDVKKKGDHPKEYWAKSGYKPETN